VNVLLLICMVANAGTMKASGIYSRCSNASSSDIMVDSMRLSTKKHNIANDQSLLLTMNAIRHIMMRKYKGNRSEIYCKIMVYCYVARMRDKDFIPVIKQYPAPVSRVAQPY